MVVIGLVHVELGGLMDLRLVLTLRNKSADTPLEVTTLNLSLNLLVSFPFLLLKISTCK
jgi:ABC-type methionine transport system permease subunit